MKKMMFVLMALGITLGAAAQRGHGGGSYHGGGYYVRPRISVGLGLYAPYGAYGYYSPFFMSPYGPYGYPYYGPRTRPSKLSMNVQDIKNDYADRIWSVRHDTRISHKERRKEVRALKQERDKAVQDEIMNYYKKPVSPVK
jgi:hypothetical protein